MASHYLALADELEADVLELQPGARLPSEHQLCSANGVSRVTARSALQELERRHLVRRTRGSGTYAAHRIPYPIRPGTTPSWSAIVSGAGHVPGYEIIGVSSRSATDATARALGVAPDTAIIQIERIGTIDGLPASHHLMRFRTEALGDDVDALRSLLETNQSTTTLLAEAFGVTIERAATRAELRPIDIARAEPLDLVGRPMAWRTETVNRSVDDHRPVEHTEAWLRADSFQVYMELGSLDTALGSLDTALGSLDTALGSLDGSSPFASPNDKRTT